MKPQRDMDANEVMDEIHGKAQHALGTHYAGNAASTRRTLSYLRSLIRRYEQLTR